MLPPPKKRPIVHTPAMVLPEGYDQVLYLMGIASLADFLDFARERADLAAPGTGAIAGNSPMDLAEAWRDAATIFEGLVENDAYPTELPPVHPLPESMNSHCETFVSRSHVQREFDRVPIALAMVPLAYLVAAQHQLNVSTTNSVEINSDPISDASLAQICLPLDAPPHTLRVLHKNADGITFAADNHDIRFLRAHAISGPIANLPSRGHVNQTLALPVGFSINVLNVIRYQNRLILNNGYHRAFALWQRGVTHAPAVIQVCRHWEDVAMVGSSELHENASVYLEHRRPPLLKDFANRQLCMSFAVRRARKYLRIRYQVETGYITG